jgi:hypothetical protein
VNNGYALVHCAIEFDFKVRTSSPTVVLDGLRTTHPHLLGLEGFRGRVVRLAGWVGCAVHVGDLCMRGIGRCIERMGIEEECLQTVTALNRVHRSLGTWPC